MSIRLKAKFKKGIAGVKPDITDVKALIKHPMERPDIDENGQWKAGTGHFINKVVFELQRQDEQEGQVVMSADWTGGVSENPFCGFKFKGGAKGDQVKLTWTDNQGGSGSKQVPIR